MSIKPSSNSPELGFSKHSGLRMIEIKKGPEIGLLKLCEFQFYKPWVFNTLIEYYRLPLNLILEGE